MIYACTMIKPHIRTINTRFDGYAETLVLRSNVIKGLKSGFTLAETLITLSVLGIVAAITIPAMVKRHVESANRTKIRAAMAAYEKLMNNLVVTEEIRTNEGLMEALYGSKPYDTTCKNINEQMQIKSFGSNNCIFTTKNGITWYFTPNQAWNGGRVYTYVALKDADAEFLGSYNIEQKNGIIAMTDEPIFQFVAYFDDSGIFHTNDNVAFSIESNKNHLHDFINGKKSLAYSKPHNQWFSTDNNANGSYVYKTLTSSCLQHYDAQYCNINDLIDYCGEVNVRVPACGESYVIDGCYPGKAHYGTAGCSAIKDYYGISYIDNNSYSNNGKIYSCTWHEGYVWRTCGEYKCDYYTSCND
ncbi:type II secretion system protein, partial [bacterium]|nr:type II secretion system protein [bacterium]